MVLLRSLEIADEVVKLSWHCCPEMPQQRSQTPCFIRKLSVELCLTRGLPFFVNHSKITTQPPLTSCSASLLLSLNSLWLSSYF